MTSATKLYRLCDWTGDGRGSALHIMDLEYISSRLAIYKRSSYSFIGIKKEFYKFDLRNPLTTTIDVIRGDDHSQMDQNFLKTIWSINNANVRIDSMYHVMDFSGTLDPTIYVITTSGAMVFESISPKISLRIGLIWPFREVNLAHCYICNKISKTFICPSCDIS